jgi:hypothetical protein
LAKEQFFYSATKPLFNKLEQLSQRSGVSRGQAFEDFLTAVVCALAAETKEDEYLAMIDRHKRGEIGRRGADLMPQMFAELVDAMSRENVDVLGDLFQGAVTYGEAGQYFSPASIAELLARMSVDPDARPTNYQQIYVHDCCCGTGRMLLAAADVNPHVELVGQDIDARCANITAINMGLRGRYGWVVCGNALSGETQFAYRVGAFFHESRNGLRRGVIRDVPADQTPVPLLAERMRDETTALFKQAPEEKEVSEPTLPAIIEVPRWLARIEPKIAALGDAGPDVGEESVDGDDPSAPEPTPGRQLELF